MNVEHYELREKLFFNETKSWAYEMANFGTVLELLEHEEEVHARTDFNLIGLRAEVEYLRRRVYGGDI